MKEKTVLVQGVLFVLLRTLCADTYINRAVQPKERWEIRRARRVI
jgi:hypothetical protein